MSAKPIALKLERSDDRSQILVHLQNTTDQSIWINDNLVFGGSEDHSGSFNLMNNAIGQPAFIKTYVQLRNKRWVPYRCQDVDFYSSRVVHWLKSTSVIQLAPQQVKTYTFKFQPCLNPDFGTPQQPLEKVLAFKMVYTNKTHHFYCERSDNRFICPPELAPFAGDPLVGVPVWRGSLESNPIWVKQAELKIERRKFIYHLPDGSKVEK